MLRRREAGSLSGLLCFGSLEKVFPSRFDCFNLPKTAVCWLCANCCSSAGKAGRSTSPS
jgi:hypothetical protein